MKFQISHSIQSISNPIKHTDKLMAMGSCFTEHIGDKLAKAGFDTVVNPTGVLFNPASILISMEHILQQKVFTEDDMFHNGSLWGSLMHSTLFSSPDLEIALTNINKHIQEAHQQLLKLDYMLITFGTAWVYAVKSAGAVVANCHKLPADIFERRRLEVHEIVSNYTKLITRIKAINPDIQFIFTVSPVRHLKDGVHENNVSKGILHLAIDSLVEEFDYLSYFPAYEIQIDELRDYRFYAEDMVHPSNQAVDYIWKRFTDYAMSDETKEINKEIEAFRRLENHRPIHQDTSEYKQFLQNLEKKKKELLEKYTFLEL